jgi:hypothetical protein
MFIRETWVNQSEGHYLGNSDWYKPYTDHLGDLFGSLKRSFGRCIGKVYVDRAVAFRNPIAVAVGWVFQKRVKYTDCDETYLQEIWVEYKE